MENIRSQLPCFIGKPKEEGFFFVTYNGKCLTASDLANIITLELCKVGYAHRGNCTKFRKMAVTMVSCLFVIFISEFLLLWYIKMMCYLPNGYVFTTTGSV